MATAAQELVAARIAVATAKLTEYRRQCWRLAGLVRAGVIDRVSAGDVLYEIAVVHGLVQAHGEDRVQAILAEAFAGAEFKPRCGEAAA
jgi:hypothetical protein